MEKGSISFGMNSDIFKSDRMPIVAAFHKRKTLAGGNCAGLLLFASARSPNKLVQPDYLNRLPSAQLSSFSNSHLNISKPSGRQNGQHPRHPKCLLQGGSAIVPRHRAWYHPGMYPDATCRFFLSGIPIALIIANPSDRSTMLRSLPRWAFRSGARTLNTVGS